MIILNAMRFGRLFIVDKTDKRKNSRVVWNCLCDCGKTVFATTDELKRGDTKSCGCLRKEKARERIPFLTEANTTHGKTKDRAYSSWASMVQRCCNKKYPRYKDYGGRGIAVCDEWLKFENFYKDMGDRPAGKTLDRIDNNGNYCKKNCKWSTTTEQADNTRKTRNVTIDGETKTLLNWARERNIKYNTINHRIRRGWNIASAITIPIKH